MIILDTNVVSALMSGREPTVDAWVLSVPANELCITAITRAEIRYGVARLPKGHRRSDLERRADAFFEANIDRVLPFDGASADRYGALAAEREQLGMPIAVLDAQIASIAYVAKASVATRNVRDFERCGIVVVNPFAASEMR